MIYINEQKLKEKYNIKFSFLWEHSDKFEKYIIDVTGMFSERTTILNKTIGEYLGKPKRTDFAVLYGEPVEYGKYFKERHYRAIIMYEKDLEQNLKLIHNLLILI